MQGAPCKSGKAQGRLGARTRKRRGEARRGGRRTATRIEIEQIPYQAGSGPNHRNTKRGTLTTRVPRSCSTAGRARLQHGQQHPRAADPPPRDTLPLPVPLQVPEAALANAKPVPPVARGPRGGAAHGGRAVPHGRGRAAARDGARVRVVLHVRRRAEHDRLVRDVVHVAGAARVLDLDLLERAEDHRLEGRDARAERLDRARVADVAVRGLRVRVRRVLRLAHVRHRRLRRRPLVRLLRRRRDGRPRPGHRHRPHARLRVRVCVCVSVGIRIRRIPKVHKILHLRVRQGGPHLVISLLRIRHVDHHAGRALPAQTDRGHHAVGDQRRPPPHRRRRRSQTRKTA
ncbi:hypothetical protein JB92DRAFT_560600 [Gautieria morchelliformis]|nr:hypothetical protein JB92DRAFT_560600 [Gautieria morchelliformis]